MAPVAGNQVIPGLFRMPWGDNVKRAPARRPAMPQLPLAGEADPPQMLRDLRDLLIVVERRLHHLREAGSRVRVTHLEAILTKKASLIERLEDGKPTKDQ